MLLIECVESKFFQNSLYLILENHIFYLDKKYTGVNFFVMENLLFIGY